MKNKIVPLAIVIFSAAVLSACGNSASTTKITPTSAPKVVEIPGPQRPYISLTPTTDGHTLNLHIANVPQNIKQVEYDLLYNAIDDQTKQEIEKGAGDTIKQVQTNIDRTFLLGTDSCTNGCKYKYDTGVVGGTLTLNFITGEGQQASL